MDLKEINDCTIFLTKAGSHAYGTSTPESDVDIRGVCIPKNKSYYIGMGMLNFEQKDSGWVNNEDKVVYDLRKALKLMSDGNPNMVDLLFTEYDSWIYLDDAYCKVLAHKDKFISKKMRHTYGGYAYAQLKRIQRHRGYLISPPKEKPERKNFGLPNKRLVSADQAGAFQWLVAKILEDSIEQMRLSDTTKTELKGVNYIGAVQSGVPDECYQTIKELTGATDEWIEAIMKEKRYEKALADWNAYQNWKNTRNEKRQIIEAKYGFDTKHAMHLVRLMRMGMEILETGKVLVKRPDAEELLAIRNGAWEYDRVVQYAQECDKKLEELYTTSKLPGAPDRNFIDNLCQEVIEGYVFRYEKDVID